MRRLLQTLPELTASWEGEESRSGEWTEEEEEEEEEEERSRSLSLIQYRGIDSGLAFKEKKKIE